MYNFAVGLFLMFYVMRKTYESCERDLMALTYESYERDLLALTYESCERDLLALTYESCQRLIGTDEVYRESVREYSDSSLYFVIVCVQLVKFSCLFCVPRVVQLY